jgi:predicted XRE-type DNA-binding protein
MTDERVSIGSSFEDWLDEHGLREEVTAAAIKAVLVEQIATEMKRQKLTKAAMATRMQTSRAQLDRLLDPSQSGVTLDSLQRAASALGRSLRLELV